LRVRGKGVETGRTLAGFADGTVECRTLRRLMSSIQVE